MHLFHGYSPYITNKYDIFSQYLSTKMPSEESLSVFRKSIDVRFLRASVCVTRCYYVEMETVVHSFNILVFWTESALQIKRGVKQRYTKVGTKICKHQQIAAFISQFANGTVSDFILPIKPSFKLQFKTEA